MNDRRKGLAFGFIPVWVEPDCIEARYWWADILFDITLPVWEFFVSISGAEPEGFPVKVKDDESQ